MAGAHLPTVLGHVQRLFSEGSLTGLSDTQLLSRFAVRRDEAAFATLVARHGPMVLTVCRGVLHDPLDAEDAFQATFLVLARKAGSAWAEGQLGGWLHRVAYRIAIRASADGRRRKQSEQRAAELAVGGFAAVKFDDDLRPTLHEEIARLPSKFRMPIVLCYLEGLTHPEAAVALRCGEATVRRRLARARERLRVRLARRGLAPGAGMLASALAREASATVPAKFVQATTYAVGRVAAGEALAVVVGARIAFLSRGGLNVIANGWKATTFAVLSLALFASVGHGVGARDEQSPSLPPTASAARRTEKRVVQIINRARPGERPIRATCKKPGP